MSTNRILLASLLLLGIIQVTGAVKCFECEYYKYNSTEYGNDECKDSFEEDTKYEEDCSYSDSDFCFKFVGSGEAYKEKVEDFVQRGCGSSWYCQGEGSGTVDGKFGKGTRYCCKGDLCNSATAALPGLTVLLASSLLFWIV